MSELPTEEATVFTKMPVADPVVNNMKIQPAIISWKIPKMAPKLTILLQAKVACHSLFSESSKWTTIDQNAGAYYFT